MFVIRKNGKDFTLPLTDQQMIKIERESFIDLFVPVADAQCIKAECGGIDFLAKLPKKIWAQEMNMLAYTIQQFSPAQEKNFLQIIAESASMYLGDMLNHALGICPEAAGLRWFHKPTGISPPHGSHAAAPIAGDASNARTMAVREYHYGTEQVMAGEGVKFSFGR